MKIIKLNSLKTKINTAKRKSKVIGLCHGVFDLLHLGHIKYLEEAKTKCDILVVTITPDIFVNKGPGRPVFNQNQRADALASLGCVDYVSINSWKTATKTISLLRPSLYIKGPDYKKFSEDITGNIKLEKKAIEKVKGKLVFTSGETFSSSTLINNNLFKEIGNKEKFLENFKKILKNKSSQNFIDDFSNLKVLLIGETILDEYVFCETVGKAGKDPFLVSKKISSETYAGGVLAGANNISDFVSEVKILSYLGQKESRLKTVKELLKKQIKFDYVSKGNSPTIFKTRYVDEYTNSKISGIYDLNDNPLSIKEETLFCEKLNKNIKNFDVVIVMDFGHGLLTEKVVDIIERKSKFLALNLQQNSFNSGFYSISKFKKADLLLINEGELRQHFRDKLSDIEILINKLMQKQKYENVIISRGNKGSILKKRFKSFVNAPGFAVNIKDRVGSGDSLFVISSLSIALNQPETFSLLLGSLAAAENISHQGNSKAISKVDLSKAVDSLLK